MQASDALAVLDEVSLVFSQFGSLRCAPTIERDDDGTTTITIVVPPIDGVNGLRVVELAQEMAYLSGLAQVRAFFTRYGIDPGALDAALAGRRSEGSE